MTTSDTVNLSDSCRFLGTKFRFVASQHAVVANIESVGSCISLHAKNTYLFAKKRRIHAVRSSCATSFMYRIEISCLTVHVSYIIRRPIYIHSDTCLRLCFARKFLLDRPEKIASIHRNSPCTFFHASHASSVRKRSK